MTSLYSPSGIGYDTCSNDACDYKSGYYVISKDTIEHQYGEASTVTSATCEATGLTTKVCSVCGDEAEEVIDALGHDYSEAITKQPSCTEEGVKTFTCANDESHTYTESIAKIDHVFGEQQTNETNTQIYKQCANCPEIEVVWDACNGNHTWDEGQTTTEPTCEAEGEGVKTCEVCGEPKEYSIPKLNHVAGEEPETVSATCEENAKATSKCAECGTVMDTVDLYELYNEEEYKALGHDMTDYTDNGDGTHSVSCAREGCEEAGEAEACAWDAGEVTTKATCNTKEITTYTCEKCEATKTEETGDMDANAHNLVENVFKAASCKANGIGYKTCSNPDCDYKSAYYTIAKLDHNYGQGEVTNDATCDAEGMEVLTCADCGATKEVSIEKLAHTYGDVMFNDNETAIIQVCTECNYVDILETLPGYNCGATAHTPAEAVKEDEVAATCEATGSYESVVYCSVCEAEISRETITVDAIAHTPAEAVKENEIAATCEAAGSYESVVYCSVCGEEISRETIAVDAIAHTPAEAVEENEIAATCEAAGSYDSVVYCSVCSVEISRETITVDALGHSLVDDAAVAATCTEDGKEAGKHCEHCDYTEGGEVIPATGHNYEDSSYYDDESGELIERQTCSHCGDTN